MSKGDLDYLLEDFVEDDEIPTLVTKENVEYFVLKNLLSVTTQLEEISSNLANDCLSLKMNRDSIVSDIKNVRFLLKDIILKIEIL